MLKYTVLLQQDPVLQESTASDPLTLKVDLLCFMHIVQSICALC